MSLNNWLCKHLDEKKKGYVTIWDLIQYTGERVLILVFAFIIVVFVGAFLNAVQGRFISDNTGLYDGVIISLKGYIVPSVVVFVLWLLYKISQIKIAKCPLKENKDMP